MMDHRAPLLAAMLIALGLALTPAWAQAPTPDAPAATVPEPAAAAEGTEPAATDDAEAAEPAVPEIVIPNVTATFEAADFGAVVTALYEKTGFGFLVAPGVGGTVTATFTDRPLDELMQLICAALDLECELQGALFVIRPVGAERPALPVVPTEPLYDGADEGYVTDLDAAAPEVTAGSLLPGAAETPAAASRPTGPVQERIALPEGRGREITAALGGGWVDAQGNYHGPEELEYQRRLMQQRGGYGAPLAASPGWADNNLRTRYRGMPRGTYTTPDGNFILPDGSIVNRNGVGLDPYGNMYLRDYDPGLAPWRRPGYQGGPYGYYPPGYNNTGGLYFQPGPLNLGGLGTLYLPPVVIPGQTSGNYYPPVVGGQYGLPYGQYNPYYPYGTPYPPRPVRPGGVPGPGWTDESGWHNSPGWRPGSQPQQSQPTIRPGFLRPTNPNRDDEVVR